MHSTGTSSNSLRANHEQGYLSFLFISLHKFPLSKNLNLNIYFFSFAYRDIPIADALLCQIEAQKRLHEQFEV